MSATTPRGSAAATALSAGASADVGVGVGVGVSAGAGAGATARRRAARGRTHRGRGSAASARRWPCTPPCSSRASIAVFPVLWIVFISLGPKHRLAAARRGGAPSGVRQLPRSCCWTAISSRWMLNSLIVAPGRPRSSACSSPPPPVRGLPDAVPRAPAADVDVPGHPDVPGRGADRAAVQHPGATSACSTPTVGLILVYCTIAVPFCAWMLKGYFDTIPVEIDEAGRVDGLTPFGTFWRLILPLARPGLAVTAFYTFLTAWGEVAYASPSCWRREVHPRRPASDLRQRARRPAGAAWPRPRY